MPLPDASGGRGLPLGGAIGGRKLPLGDRTLGDENGLLKNEILAGCYLATANKINEI